MSTEKERWAKLAGLPESTDKQQLDENFVGMGMVGNIFDREKEQYEDAFEHFLSERYEEKVEENYTTEVRDAWPSLSIDDRVSLLLTVFDDPDMAEEMAEKDFDALPDAATSNMRMDMLEEGELNDEGETSLASKIKNMIEVELMDLPITDEVVEEISNKIYREIKALLNF